MSQKLLMTVVCVYLITGWISPISAQDLPLGELFSLARKKFLAGQYVEANEYFRELEAGFSQEPEFLDVVFQKYFRSMLAMSALLSGDYAAADEALSMYLRDHYKATQHEATLLIGFIQAKKNLGLLDQSIPLYDRFLRDYPNHFDRYLIQFEKMMILFHMDDMEKGHQEMQSIWDSSAPMDIRFRARLTAMQQRLNKGHMELAGELLLSTNWEIATMPELAVLATLSLKIGEWFASRKNYDRAILAFRRVPFYETLVKLQRERLKSLEKGMSKLHKQGVSGKSMMWEPHYQTLLSQVKERLSALEAGEDYTPTFLLKYGRCFLHSERFAEAWVIFRSLARSDDLSSEIKEQAWYHWILASHGSENWDEARSLCLRFGEIFPDSPLLPQSLYLLARTHQDAGAYTRANTVLTDLMERFPTHVDFANWQLTRGFNFATLNDNAFALIDYESVIQHAFASESLKIRAQFWRAITLHSDAKYEASLQALNALIANHPEHWMFPEFRYRLATVYYSMRNYEQTEQELNQFLKRFPEHFHTSEAKVLLGDVAMGKGELDQALELFKTIKTDNPRLYMYAYFQIGKILRACEQYAKMENHFRQYVEKIEFREKSRISEALYWLGWALTQNQREDETLPLYLGAVERFGDDPFASELIPMIQTLEGIKKKATPSNVDRVLQKNEIAFLQASGFDEWLVQQIDLAQAESKLTYYARLQLYEALKLRRQKNKQLARSAIQGISVKVSLDVLDDQLLGEIGASLAEDGFESCLTYLKRLLIAYPKSPHKALAYYGLATYEMDREHWEDSLKWLNLFEKETPNHAQSIQVKLLKGHVLKQLGRYEQAISCLNDLLRIKHARGEPHVKAIIGLAETYEASGRPRVAIPYWQRIYTLYRAYRPHVARAYWESARLFSMEGDAVAQIRSYEEFLEQDDLMEFPEYMKAQEALMNLKAKPSNIKTIEKNQTREAEVAA